ncbi:uncharacterized protein BROUX77_001692 [Berkeleyomyces rouxiae]|uniref:uncharacterized protein n=1 Tax=Berkeleyomyces rouxiae TaxID=2035830 RepID=UPI003B765564
MPLSVSSVVTATFAFSQVALGLPSSSSPRFVPGSNTGSPIDIPPKAEYSWSVEQVQNTEFGLDGPTALANIYTKFSVPIPDEMELSTTRHKKRGTFYSTLWDTLDNVFLIPVSIGVPRKSFNLIFDTARSGVWVFSKKVADPQLQKAYIPDASTSSKQMKEYSWKMDDQNGQTSSGDVYNDIFSFDTSVRSMPSPHQAIQVVDVAAGFPNLKYVSGVLGMAFTSRNPIQPQPQPSVFDNIKEKLDQQVFTVDMKHFAAGKVEFGRIDDDAYLGRIRYSSVLNKDGLWNFTIGGLVGDTILGTAGIDYAIADTASALLMLPIEDNIEYYHKVDGSRLSEKHGGFVFPCSSKMPNFDFKVGGARLTIPGTYMKLSMFHDEPELCFGGLQPSNKLGFNLIGSIVFKAAFVIFDPVNAKIGWARKKLSGKGVDW